MLRCQQSEGSLGSDSRPDAIQAKSDPRSWRRAIPLWLAVAFGAPVLGETSARVVLPSASTHDIAAYCVAANSVASAWTTRLIWVPGCLYRSGLSPLHPQ
jgi:hypothetical protein